MLRSFIRKYYRYISDYNDAAQMNTCQHVFNLINMDATESTAKTKSNFIFECPITCFNQMVSVLKTLVFQTFFVVIQFVHVHLALKLNRVQRCKFCARLTANKGNQIIAKLFLNVGRNDPRYYALRKRCFRRNQVHHGGLFGHGGAEILLEGLARSHQLRIEKRLHEVHRTVEPYGQAE